MVTVVVIIIVIIEADRLIYSSNCFCVNEIDFDMMMKINKHQFSASFLHNTIYLSHI